MADRPIQEQFGERVIAAFADFARADLSPPDELEQHEFSHVSDAGLRKSLAQVFYGVRWIYKLGLALLTHDAERAAHVRAQIVDYASVAEGLLSHCIAHAIRRGHTAGDAFNWANPVAKSKPIRWNVASPEPMLGRQTFWWLIQVAHEFGVVNAGLAENLHWLREQRNTVHLRQRASMGQTAFLNQSKKAFSIVTRTIEQTKIWRAHHA